MGIIFDIHSAKLYEDWRRTSRGKAMDSFLERLVPVLLKPEKGERVLDIGCGTGNHLLILNKFGLELTGVDASPYMIDMAKKRLGNKCTLKKGDARDLPFDDNEFDLAVFINTMEFLDDPLTALREAGRVARKKVFIAAINSFCWYSVYYKLFDIFMDNIFSHIKTYHLWELKTYMQTAYGPISIAWESENSLPGFLNQTGLSRHSSLIPNKSPFGSFLGLSATIDYIVKTDNLPLKAAIKKPGQPVAGGITNISNLKEHPS